MYHSRIMILYLNILPLIFKMWILSNKKFNSIKSFHNYKNDILIHSIKVSTTDIDINKNNPSDISYKYDSFSNSNNNNLDQTINKKVSNDLNLIFLPGFGVGTFHYNRNIESILDSLSSNISSHQYDQIHCYSMDWIGQGESWPQNDKACNDLRYDGLLWCNQLEWFIENHIISNSNSINDNHNIYLVGNSLGGFIAVQVAARRSDLIKGLILINPTPIWSFQPPLTRIENDIHIDKKSNEDIDMIDNNNEVDEAWRPFNWKANLPAPKPLKAIGSTIFNLMRDRFTIKQMLSTVYANSSTVDEELIENILKGASNSYGPDAFTSIMFAPKMPDSFEEQLLNIPITIPCLLLYGSNDPWITPFWGDRTYRRLQLRKNNPQQTNNNSNNDNISPSIITKIEEQNQQSLNTIGSSSSNEENKASKIENVIQYYITPCGHCGHHETSNIVNHLIVDWLMSINNNNNNNNNASIDDNNNLNYIDKSVDNSKIEIMKDNYIIDDITATRSYGIYNNELSSKLLAYVDNIRLKYFK